MQVQLSEYIDKVENFASLAFVEQAKYLAYFYVKITNDPIFTARNIKDFFGLANVTKPQNVTDVCKYLTRKKVFIPAKDGFKLHRNTLQELEAEFSRDKPKRNASKKLRELLPKVGQVDNRSFLSEAISCYEIDAHRSAIVMTWLLVVDNLYEYILANKLVEFNNALANQGLKIGRINSKEDFNELREGKFIELCRSANIISNDVRKILEEKLGIRNTCAHPNDIVVGESKATNFIEDLIDNVLVKYHK